MPWISKETKVNLYISHLVLLEKWFPLKSERAHSLYFVRLPFILCNEFTRSDLNTGW